MRIEITATDSLARCQRASADYGWHQITLGRNPGGGFRMATADGYDQPVAITGVSSYGFIAIDARGIVRVLLDVGDDSPPLAVSDPVIVGDAVGELWRTRERALNLI